MHLPLAFNIPIEELEGRLTEVKELLSNRSTSSPLMVICRRGNASQMAVQQLRMAGFTDNVVDIIGGMTQWSKDVDSFLPIL
jgi:adenylyltransferase/sulfurtransferase